MAIFFNGQGRNSLSESLLHFLGVRHLGDKVGAWILLNFIITIVEKRTNYFKSQLLKIKSISGDDTVAQWVMLSSAMLVSHMGVGWYPSGSTSDPPPCSCPAKSNGRWPKYLDTCEQHDGPRSSWYLPLALAQPWLLQLSEEWKQIEKSLYFFQINKWISEIPWFMFAMLHKNVFSICFKYIYWKSAVC